MRSENAVMVVKIKIYLLIAVLLIELMSFIPEKQLLFAGPVASVVEKQPQDGTHPQAEKVEVIQNIEQWNHPVKEVFVGGFSQLFPLSIAAQRNERV